MHFWEAGSYVRFRNGHWLAAQFQFGGIERLGHQSALVQEQQPSQAAIISRHIVGPKLVARIRFLLCRSGASSIEPAKMPLSSGFVADSRRYRKWCFHSSTLDLRI